MSKLIVKPILLYSFYKRKEKRSWRPWGGIQTEKDLENEINRIENELLSLKERADFPLEILKLSTFTTSDSLKEIKDLDKADVLLIYAASGPASLLEKITSTGKWNVIFIRRESGPVYLWYEVIHPTFLRKYTDRIIETNVSLSDIVVDDYNEVLWKLRALYGLKTTLGAKIVVIGEPSGWGAEGRVYGPYLARKIWNFEFINISYDELKKRIDKIKSDKNIVRKAEEEAKKYVSSKGIISVKTDMRFIVNAFILYYVFKELLKEYDAKIITIKECMSTIMPIAETTACLVLSLLNDEGYIALCESDFVAIPAAVLLHFISQKPVFFNDPTLPHNGLVTLAHCTAPRKMDGKSLENVELLTHFESDYGVAPKVLMKRGQAVTVIDPDFEGKVWLGFKGKIIKNPSYAICRSQVDVQIEGNWRKLLREIRGFHWVLCYGDYLKEVGYALEKVGIRFVNMSEQ